MFILGSEELRGQDKRLNRINVMTTVAEILGLIHGLHSGQAGQDKRQAKLVSRVVSVLLVSW